MWKCEKFENLKMKRLVYDRGVSDRWDEFENGSRYKITNDQ